MVIPIFMTLFVSICEFGFLFTTYISVGYASRDAVQMAATMGNTVHADAAILQRIEQDISTPADPAKITSVDIFWVNTSSGNYAPVSGAETIYNYAAGNHPFTLPDMTTVIQLPFVQLQNGYPETQRCNVNKGIGCLPSGVHTTVDTIVVKITYQYAWVTPFPQLVGASANGPLITQINIMRLEPVL